MAIMLYTPPRFVDRIGAGKVTRGDRDVRNTAVLPSMNGARSLMIAIVGGQTLVALLLGACGSIVQLLPLAAATFFWPRATRPGAIAGTLAGVLYNYGITFELIPTLWDINPSIQGLVVKVVVLVSVSLASKPIDRTPTERFVNL